MAVARRISYILCEHNWVSFLLTSEVDITLLITRYIVSQRRAFSAERHFGIVAQYAVERVNNTGFRWDKSRNFCAECFLSWHALFSCLLATFVPAILRNWECLELFAQREEVKKKWNGATESDSTIVRLGMFLMFVQDDTSDNTFPEKNSLHIVPFMYKTDIWRHSTQITQKGAKIQSRKQIPRSSFPQVLHSRSHGVRHNNDPRALIKVFHHTMRSN